MNNFEKVYQQSEHLIDLAIYKCGIRYDLEHYLQVGRVALWQAYIQFEGDLDGFNGYAYVFIKNTLLNEIRKMRRTQERMLLAEDDTMLEVFATKEDEPPDEAKYYAEKVLEGLNKEEQELLIALYVHGYTYEEVARALNISVHTLKKRRDRLIKKIRLQKYTIFSDYGG